MSRKMLYGCLAVAALVAAPAAVHAVPIAIVNPSFETPVADPTSGFTPNGTPVDGWTGSDVFKGGQWDINAFPLGFWTVPVPDGNQILYAGFNGPASYTQTLVDTLQANTIYNLTGFVGAPDGFAVPQTISLSAGGNVLASLTSTPPNGHFDPFTVTFDSTGSAFIGQALEIQLLSSGSQDAWDDIHLDASPVPEPSTLLLALGGIVALISRKAVKRTAQFRTGKRPC